MKPQMLEAVFVAGCVLAGMTVDAWHRIPELLLQAPPVRVELVRKNVNVEAILGTVQRIIIPRRIE
jgi:hypothetical protein